MQLTLANVTQETRAALDQLGAISMKEVPLSLEEAFVRYMGGPAKFVSFASDEPEPSEAVAETAAGGVA